MKKESTYTPFELLDSFDPKDIFIDYVKNSTFQIVKNSKRVEYINIPAELDIESSSFYDVDNKKTAIMYCFTLGINGHSYFGRTYDDLFQMLNLFKEQFGLSLTRRLIIYIHNLAYEFQFLYKRFRWNKIFAAKNRTPITALTEDGIEFRCSLLLSGYSLAKVGENLQTYKVEKMVGDLDYDLIRHSETPMNDKEIGYVLHDGLVVMAYIQEQIESHKNNISRIPLTKTGEVRKYCRDACLYGGGGSHKKAGKFYHAYRNIIRGTNIRSVNEYKQLKRAFSGGFTHANALMVNRKIKNVTSFDFTSSYPYIMISEKFPMLRGKLVEIKTHDEFRKSLDKYCCLFDITFFEIEPIINFEHYISFSHCRNTKNYMLDNGRLISADEVTLTITEQDFFIIEKCYRWKKFQIFNFRRYMRNYLPTPFVKSILDLYKKKTELKGITGKEIEYLHSKELLNSCYGMCVTDICREEIPFDIENNKWLDEKPIIDYEKNIGKYNNSKQRFLSYAWGIWVTAYARRNLWNGILEFQNDYIYSDTDSVKVINYEKHKKYIEDYNNKVAAKLKTAMEYHDIPFEMCLPKTIDGIPKLIGVWDNETEKGYEYTYSIFKTLGAKRYMVEYPNGKHSLTISGLNKKVAIPYLEKNYSDIFDAFEEDMYIPPEFTGKNTHTYIDEPRDGYVTDYLGNTKDYHELTCVHMAGADYTLSLAREYVEYLFLIARKEIN